MFNPAGSFKAFLGEREETFVITPALISELERVTGTGLGTLFKRLSSGEWHHGDILHTIRLGLIGGGLSPEQAARICTTYVAERPIIESYGISLSILERLWLGAPVVEALIKEITKASDATD